MPSKWSLWSEDSLLCIASDHSVMSVGSIGSSASAFSVGSFASLFSVGSSASVGSVLSSASRHALLSHHSDGGTQDAYGVGDGRPALLAGALLVASAAGYAAYRRLR
jgi:hypothetical protein